MNSSSKYVLLLFLFTWIVQSTATTENDLTAAEDGKASQSAASRLFDSAFNTLSEYATKLRSAIFVDENEEKAGKAKKKMRSAADDGDVDDDDDDEERYGFDPYFQPGYDVGEEYHSIRSSDNNLITLTAIIICSLFKIIL